MKQNPATILVITSYPRKGHIHGEGTVGIASYTKNTLIAIKNAAKKQDKDVGITVLAEKLADNKDTSYSEDGIKVKRIWERNNPFLFLSLIQEILHYPKTQTLLVECELAMFGNFFMLPLFALFLLFTRFIFRKNIYLVLHQVVETIAVAHGHVTIPKESVYAKLFNKGIKLFYKLVFIASKKIIVFQEDLAQKLVQFTKREKILVIPHGVEIVQKIPTKSLARLRLGIPMNAFVVLCFGFIAWYKGSDWIVKDFKKWKEKNIHLILAGGKNPNHVEKPFYKKYVQDIATDAKNTPNVSISGFIPEADIPYYFAASDLVLFPYRALLSASGPMAIALSFTKPFLVSDSMEGVFADQDIHSLLEKYQIHQKQLMFSTNANDCEEKVSHLRHDMTFYQKVVQLTKELAKERTFAKIGQAYLNTFI